MCWNSSLDPFFQFLQLTVFGLPCLSERYYVIFVSFLQIVQIDGVTGYSRPHFWRHSSKSLCGTLHIQAQSSASEQKLIQQVRMCKVQV